MDIQNISIGADPNLLIEEGIYNIVNDATVHANHPSITEGGVLVVKSGTNSKLTQTFIGSWGIYTRSGTFSTAWGRADWVLNGVDSGVSADGVVYDNDTSLLNAEDVQEAIDEIVTSMFTPVEDTWHDCAMGEYTVGEDTYTQTGWVKCRKDALGYLEIYGNFTQYEDPTESNPPYFTLPEGYRTNKQVKVPIPLTDATPNEVAARLVFNTAGDVIIEYTMFAISAYLNGLQYFRVPLVLPDAPV